MNSFLQQEEADGIARIFLNRPSKLNAYDYEMLFHLEQQLEHCSEREDIRGIVIEGKGNAFCTGSDVEFLRELHERSDVNSFRRMQEATRRIILLLRRVPQFTIASIDGPASDGGFNLALSCDYRIATRYSLFGHPIVGLGLSPEVGVSMLLVPIMGPARTLEMTVSGEMLSARTARQAGIVNEIVEEGQLSERTKKIALRFTAGPPLVLRSVKRSIHEKARVSERLLEAEIEGRIRCFLSDDSREGFQAFIENRLPRFRGQ